MLVAGTMTRKSVTESASIQLVLVEKGLNTVILGVENVTAANAKYVQYTALIWETKIKLI